jgi:hypothetical protein
MAHKLPKLRALTVLTVQLFSFWLALGYVSCFFVLSLPVSASELNESVSFTMPHKQLFMYAKLTTLVSLLIAMVSFWVQTKTMKLHLIRLYRHKGNRIKK